MASSMAGRRRCQSSVSRKKHCLSSSIGNAWPEVVLCHGRRNRCLFDVTLCILCASYASYASLSLCILSETSFFFFVIWWFQIGCMRILCSGTVSSTQKGGIPFFGVLDFSVLTPSRKKLCASARAGVLCNTK